MKRSALFILFLLLFVSFVSFGANSPAPDFTLSSTDGAKITLSKLKGKVALLNFFAEWCVPCREEIPVLNAWQKKYAPDLLILGIDYDHTTAKEVSALKKQMGIEFTCLVDKSKLVQKGYKLFSLPASFLINGDGMLVKRLDGGLSGKKAKDAEEDIKQLVKLAQEKKNALFVYVTPFENRTQKAKQNQLAEKLTSALTAFLKSQSGIKLSSDAPSVRIEGTVSMFSDEAGVGIKLIDVSTGDTLSTISKPVSGAEYSPLFSALLEQLKALPR